ncbi:DUF4145 domain-containing protein [Alcanivorax sp. VBW004]|uniref:DUF4145 domain-containing protein n=1 Tax=Alcanivorax sp. VBW004 TaxID=1287708 RepID=UPI0012BCDEE4|nr:DUF4145 domain-containing protein [Alcanivorax sp. VBW004]MTT50969.1 DUF4145 domain-containing protein [Alcanivorax sp. VBW004]
MVERTGQDLTLMFRLKELGEKGEIPKTLSEASNIFRVIGNVGAHANKRDVHPLQVLALDEFFKAIVEYVYVSPSKIESFRARMDSYNKSNE